MLINVSFGLPAPEAAALLIPAISDLLHVKTAPEVLLFGTYENKVLLQISAGVRVLVNAGIGFTTTTTLYVEEPEHPLAESEYR